MKTQRVTASLLYIAAGVSIMALVATFLVTTAHAQTTSVHFRTNINLPERFQGEVPAIRFTNAQQTSDGTIVVEWYTTEFTNGKVVFSTEAAMNSENNTIVRSTKRGWRHVIELPALTENTTYYYYVMSEDEDYHTARSDRRAFTLQEGEIEDHDSSEVIE